MLKTAQDPKPPTPLPPIPFPHPTPPIPFPHPTPSIPFPHPTPPFQVLNDCTISCTNRNVTCKPPKHQANQIPNYLKCLARWLGWGGCLKTQPSHLVKLPTTPTHPQPNRPPNLPAKPSTKLSARPPPPHPPLNPPSQPC